VQSLIERPTSVAVYEERFRLLTAFGLLLGAQLYIFGAAWDIQWHADVGPDTFFTAPHSVLYGGVTLAGLVALYALIRTTIRHRAGTLPPGSAARFLGAFRAPTGVIIAGLGAVAFICGGLFDLWWHTLYGFDVTLASPPHVMLLFSGMQVLMGALYLFAGRVTQARRIEGKQGGLLAAEVGVICTLASILQVTGSLFLLIALWNFPRIGAFATFPVIQGLVIGLILAVAVSSVRRPGAALGVALVALLWKLLTYVAVPALVAWLAGHLSLSYFENAIKIPATSYVGSAYLFIPAVSADLVLWLGQRRGWPVWRLALLTAGALAVGTAILLTVDPLWLKWGEAQLPERHFDVARYLARYTGTTLRSVALGTGMAALCGLLGWRFGQILRYHRQ
jgi:hypothetical protein